MKNQLVIRHAKVDVLLIYWDKLYGIVQQGASLFRDKNANALCKKLICINKEVQKHMLLAYVNRCRELHSIAFLQWRLMYPSEFVNRQDIQELILARINNLNNNMNLGQRPNEETLKNSKISSKFLDKASRFVLKEEKQTDKTFLINRFFDIGWADPFAADNDGLVKDQLLTDPEDLVYENCRYVQRYSPYVIYVPKKEVMLKIMRACIGCKQPKDLWIHSGEAEAPGCHDCCGK